MLEIRSGFEILDREFDGRVLAMEPIDVNDVTGEVGEERMVAPVGPQFLLCGVGESCAADNHPTCHPFGSVTGGVRALGDLRLAVAGVVNVLPGVVGNRHDRCLHRTATTLVLIAIVVVHIGPCQVDDGGVVPEPRIEPKRQRSGQVIAAGPSDEFVDDTFRAALSVCRTVTESAVQDLAVAAIVASNG
jgi:hypothetical protein